MNQLRRFNLWLKARDDIERADYANSYNDRVSRGDVLATAQWRDHANRDAWDACVVRSLQYSRALVSTDGGDAYVDACDLRTAT